MPKRDKPPGITEAHVRITLSLLNSPAYIALDYSSKALFLDLRSRLRSTNNGNINAALSELKHRGWKAPATLAKALRQLEAVGLLRKTRATVGVEHGSKVCNLYRFTDMECWAQPKLGIDACKATDEYKAFTTLSDARRAAKQAAPGKKRSLQKLKRDATEIEATARIDATETEVTPLHATSKTEASPRRPNARKAKAGAASEPIPPIH